MNKTEIEFVLALGLNYLRPDLRDRISDVDLHVTVNRIWHDIKRKKNKKSFDKNGTVYYHVFRTDLEKVLAGDSVEISYDDGSKISLVLLEDERVKTRFLENGGILMWYEGDEK